MGIITLAKVITNYKRNILTAILALATLGCVIGTSYLGNGFEDVQSTLEVWHPYKNYLCTRVPNDILEEETPSGLTLGKVQNIIKTTYVEGAKPLYINGVLIANKTYRLPPTFDNNTDIAREAEEKFEEMKSDAKKDSLHLNAFSVYRSYQRQETLYSNYVARDGQAAADRYSARPGASEHQTGLAFDIGGTDTSRYASTRFDGTAEANWLKDNAYKYGFVLRYMEGKEDITGYMHESWHYRYVTTDYSTEIHNTGLTIEEYFGLNKINTISEYF